MPTARAIWARRIMLASISPAAVAIKSANSSTTKTIWGILSFGCLLLNESRSRLLSWDKTSNLLSISPIVHLRALIVSAVFVITGVNRWGIPLYIVNSTRFGSTIIIRSVSAVFWYSRLVKIVFTQTVLPLPVEPAISKWGMRGRSANQTFPATSLPRAIIILCFLFLHSSLSNNSLKVIVAVFSFGTSIPTKDCPGIGASILIG